MSAGFVIRHEDYTLSEEQQALRDSFRAFFAKTVDATRVRAAEPLGFDADLWNELVARHVVSMALPESAGGDGATLTDLVLVVEEAGRCAAPIPLVENLAGARTLARLDPTGATLNSIRDSGQIVTLAPGPLKTPQRALVPAGAVAQSVILRDGEKVVVVTGAPLESAVNLACAPWGWWDLRGGMPIGDAAAFSDAERDWRLLTAAALVGLGQAAVGIGVQYANERSAFGTTIGAFQAIAHPLVDAAAAVEGARRLTWRAAWFADNEPESIGALAISALLSAATAAEKAAATAIHTQGGFGLTLESDAQLFYRRAKGWAAPAGDRRALLTEAADRVLHPFLEANR